MNKFNLGDKIFDGQTEWVIINSTTNNSNPYFFTTQYILQDALGQKTYIDEGDLELNIIVGPYIWTPRNQIAPTLSAGIHIPQSEFPLQFEIHRGPKIGHDGHDVITNTAMNKEFRYCRNCKVEV